MHAHGLGLFSHSAEREGEGRVGGNRTCASGVVARPPSRQACHFVCAPVNGKRGTRKMGCIAVSGSRALVSPQVVEPVVPVVAVPRQAGQGSRIRGLDALWAIRLCEKPSDLARIGMPRWTGWDGERAPLVGRLALPRVVCVCGEMSHFGRSVRALS